MARPKRDPMPKPRDVRAKIFEGKIEFQLFPRPKTQEEIDALESKYGMLKVYDKTSGQVAMVKGETIGLRKAGTDVRAEGTWDYNVEGGWQFIATRMDESSPAQRLAVDAWAKAKKVNLDEIMVGRVASQWGAEADEVLSADPYALCLVGMPFKQADELVGGRLVRAKGDERRAAAAMRQALADAEEQGHTYLPHDKAVTKLGEMLGLAAAKDAKAAQTKAIKILREDENITVAETGIYHTETHRVEERVARLLLERASDPQLAVNEDSIVQAATTPGFELTDEQREAAISLHAAPLAIITGGPGTGKTRSLSNGLDSLDAADTSFKLSAPTGKAAKRMTEATERDAQTLHSLLDWRYVNGSQQLPKDNDADMVIVDEASMVDVHMMERLLSALRPEQRLVLVGDVDQLPSVGIGSVFHDIIAASCGRVTRLTKTFRQGAGSLLLINAQRVRDGKSPYWTKEAAEAVEGPVLDDFQHIDTKNATETAKRVFELAQSHPDSMVISPQRAGICGVHNLNRLFQKNLNPKGSKVMETEEYTLRVGDKVLVTKNQKPLGIVNGDIGMVLKSPDPDFVRISVDGSMVDIEAPKAEKVLELGYVLTIHKSQGSQAHQVICPLEEGKGDRMLNRNLIYTAWTRGQASCIVVGPKSAVEKAIKINGTDRDTGLKEMLVEGLAQMRPTLSKLSHTSKAKAAPADIEISVTD